MIETSVETTDLPQRFHALLDRVCTHFNVPHHERTAVLSSQALSIGKAPMSLQLEEWSAFIKVFVDVGRPADQDAPALHRYLLTQQLIQPAPFYMSAGVHPETEHVILYGYSPMPTDAASEEGFFAFLQGCALLHEAIRVEAPAQVVWG
jgi:hypothetical protein